MKTKLSKLNIENEKNIEILELDFKKHSEKLKKLLEEKKPNDYGGYMDLMNKIEFHYNSLMIVKQNMTIAESTRVTLESLI